MKVFVILSHNSDGCTYACNDALESVWSSEELALKRLYFLEKYHKDELKGDEYGSFGFQIVELGSDQILRIDSEREAEWLNEIGIIK